jgi:hypothetical protein
MSLAWGSVYSDGWESVFHCGCSCVLCRSGGNRMHRVIQEERLTFWEAVVPVIMGKTMFMNMLLILNGYWVRPGWTNKYKSIVSGKLLTVNLIFIQHLSETITATVQHKCPKNPIVNVGALVCEDHVSLVWVDVFSYVGSSYPKFQWTIHLIYPPFFCKIHSLSIHTNKNQMEGGKSTEHQIQTAVSR